MVIAMGEGEMSYLMAQSFSFANKTSSEDLLQM